MATVLDTRERSQSSQMPLTLHSGDHLDQRTFHARYERMPRSFRAELIQGVVIVPSPATNQHGEYHGQAIHWLGHYRIFTPGTRMVDNGTVILDDENEPQPDGVLRVEESCGGRSAINPKGYVTGPPELHVEVAYTSEAIDLYEKRETYERCGVLEYVVVLIREGTCRCFRFEQDHYVETQPDADGVWRSSVFPGLWLHRDALIRLDGKTLIATLEQGLQTSEHADFVKRLESTRTSAS